MNETSPRGDRSATTSPNGAGAGENRRPARAEETRSGEHTHVAERRRGSGILDYLVTIVVALLVAILVKTFLIQPFFIPSDSMVPTLERDDKIIVSKLTPGVFDLHRGDVVVFEDPGDWVGTVPGAGTSPRARIQKVFSYIGLTPDPDQNHLVKRLIGMPGDRVTCAQEGGELQVNGVTVDEPYINPENPACKQAFDVTVPEGSFWVMGDNRYDSADSAYHYVTSGGHSGFVPEDAITGKAVLIMWPVGRWSGLDAGEDAFADVPDPA